LRRFEEQKLQSSQTLDEVERDIQRRDRNDSTREVAPLKPAPDAIIIDSTELTAEAVVDLMVSHLEE
jgi:cytidylate kinase